MKKPTSGHSGGGLSMKDVSCLRRQSRPLAESVMDVQQQHMHFRLGVLIAGMMIEREEGGSQFNSFEMESRPPAHALRAQKVSPNGLQ
jgi:hypothetical protein